MRNEHHGVWWIINTPFRKIPGVLHFETDGPLTLDVTGCLCDDNSIDLLPEGLFRIAGQLEGGRHICLEGCAAISSHGLGDIAARESWHVHEAVFDAVFDASDPWAFYGGTFAIPMLTRWVRNAHIQQTVHREDGNSTLRRIEASVDFASFPLWTKRGATLSLGTSASTRRSSEWITELQARVDVAIRTESAMTSYDLRRLLQPLQLLLGLSTGRFTSATFGTALIGPDDKQYADWRWHPLELDHSKLPTRPAFLYSEWHDTCSHNIDFWLDRLDRIEPVIDLYLSSLRRLGLAELQFQIVVQALETYHRRLCGGQSLPDIEWQRLRTCLNETVNEFAILRENSDDWRVALLSKLTFMNELSLSTRLKELFNNIDAVLLRVSGGPIKKLVRRVVATRNYFTHWTDVGAPEALSGAELIYATSRLLALLELLLLRDVGFSLSSNASSEIIRRRITQFLP